MGNSYCKACGKCLGELEHGDVVECLNADCRQWHWKGAHLWAIERKDVAELAKQTPEGMDNYDLLAALDESAAAMEPEGPFFLRETVGYRAVTWNALT